MGSFEFGRHLRQNCDNILSKKRLALVTLFCIFTIVYVFPYLIRWFRTPVLRYDSVELCIKDRVSIFSAEISDLSAAVKHVPSDEANYAPYVGNGNLGFDIEQGAVYLKNGRNLVQKLPFLVNLFVNKNVGNSRSVYISNFRTGIVHVFQCFGNGLYFSYQYYAHRLYSSILVQEVKISNPTDFSIEAKIELNGGGDIKEKSSRMVEIHGQNSQYNLTSGYFVAENGQSTTVAIIHRSTPVSLRIEARASIQISNYVGISYSNEARKDISKLKAELETSVIDELKRVSKDPAKETHVQIWQKLWTTGFSIQTSKANDALNGDKINATIYYVLSQVKLH